MNNYTKNEFLKTISDIQKKDDDSYVIKENGTPIHIINQEPYLQKHIWITEYLNENPNNAREYKEIEYTLSLEQKIKVERNNRDRLLTTADNLLLKYQEQVTLGIVQENKNYYTALLQYKQNLRDITKQAEFPENIIYPTLPKYEDYIK